MKRIVIACGAGLATSSMVRESLKELLRRRQIQATLIQCTLAEIDSFDGAVDLIITTTKVRKRFQTPCLTGGAFLSGVGEKDLGDRIIEALRG